MVAGNPFKRDTFIKDDEQHGIRVLAYHILKLMIMTTRFINLRL